MANISFEVDLSTTWSDLTTDESLVVGRRYLVDVVNLTPGAEIHSAKTDSAGTAPDGIEGHIWSPVNWARGLNQRSFEQKTGQFLWAKVSEGTGKLCFTEV